MVTPAKRILFLVPYPAGIAPSQRFRFEQYFESLTEAGFEFEVQSFLNEKTWKIFYFKGHFFAKISGVIRGFIRRWLLLPRIASFDFVFIHRETAPLGLPVYPWIIARVMRKKIIFDFDDAIWMENYSDGNALFAFLKKPSNAKKLMKWSWKNSCGNEFLRQFALQYNPHSYYIPTTIDTKKEHTVRVNRTGPLTIGWTGTHSTTHNLNGILSVLREVLEKNPVRFLLISDIHPGFELPGMEFRRWNKTTEIRDLSEIHVGLMPLWDNKWSRGKCGLKILQYMALGIVPVVSAVGVNTHIVRHGVNGLTCSSPEQWKEVLTFLINNPHEIERLSLHTRNRVEEEFSTASQRLNFLRLFAAGTEH